MSRRLNGFFLQLLGIVILPLGVILLAFAVFSTQIHQDAMRNLVAERNERAARAAAAAISRQLNHLGSAFYSLGFRLADGIPPSVALEQATFLEDDFSSGMAVLSTNGRVMASSNNYQQWLGLAAINYADLAVEGQPIFFEVKVDNRSHLALVLTNTVEGMTLVGAVPVGELMLAANLSPSVDVVGYRAYIINADGQILSTLGNAAESELLANRTGLAAALRGETGTSFLPSEEGEIVAAYAPIPITQWTLVIEEPWEAVASPALDFSQVGPLALAPALFLTLLAIWFGSRQVIGPLRRLENEASNLAMGRHDSLQEQVGGIAEIVNLQETLIDMSNRIRQAQDALHGYINAITRAQEDERKRLARELHDETIQDLIVLGQKLQLFKMRSQLHSEDSLADMEAIDDTLQQTIGNIRRISRGLRPIYLEDLGLVPALEMLAQDADQNSSMAVDFQCSGAIKRLHPDTEMALYRIVQESLSNISRHSGAGQAALSISFAEECILISVRDDGIGFELPDQTADLALSGHFGLIGIMERADLVGADLQIESEPGKGTLIRLELRENQT